MGDARRDALKVGFDGSIRLEFHGATVSSDGGLLAYRDVDDALALTATAGATLTDWRTGTNIRHSLTALLRQSIYSRLAGYDDLNDADRLAVDPVMRQVVGGRATEKQAASTSQMAHFETAVLTRPDNLKALMDLSGKWIGQVQQHRPLDRIILDLDSSVSETHGEQEGSAYNGYFEWIKSTLAGLIVPTSERVSPSKYGELPFIGLEHVEAHTMRLLPAGIFFR
ncbi:MAG: transposase [Planctomycetes bacterium]|nr:transposase [Planctomycetota bacterium]